MRCSLLGLVIGSLAVAAPTKDQLPRGALGRIGTQVAPAKDTSPPDEVHSLTFLDTKQLFVGTNKGWNAYDVQTRKPCRDKPVDIPAYAVIRDSKRLFIRSTNKLHCVEPLQSATLEPVRSWDSTVESLGVLAISPGERRVVFASGDQKLAILDTKEGKIAGTFQLASKPVAVALAANGRALAVVTRDGAARVYNLASEGKIEMVWSKRVARSDRVAAAFSPDGLLFAVSSAGRVFLLDSVAGRTMQSIERRFGEGDVRCIAFSPDSRLIAIGTNGPEPVVRISEVVSGTERAMWTDHLGDVNAVAFSPNGAMLASGDQTQASFFGKFQQPSRQH